MKKYLLITTMASSLIGGMSYGSATAGGSGWSTDSEDGSKPSLARRLLKAFDITSSSMTEEDFIVREAALLKRELDLKIKEMALHKLQEELSSEYPHLATSFKDAAKREKELKEEEDRKERKRQKRLELLNKFEMAMDELLEADNNVMTQVRSEFGNPKALKRDTELLIVDKWEERMSRISRRIYEGLDQDIDFSDQRKIFDYVKEKANSMKQKIVRYPQ